MSVTLRSIPSPDELLGSVKTGCCEESRFRDQLDQLKEQLSDIARASRGLFALLSPGLEALICGGFKARVA